MDLRKIGAALAAHREDWNGVNPTNWIEKHSGGGRFEKAVWGLVSPYASDRTCFHCPSYALWTPRLL